MVGSGAKNIWIVANWKSNETIEEALNWVSKVGPRIEKKPNLKVVVCPTYTAIEEVKKTILVGNFPLLVGAQDLSPFDSGAYTGEESAKILKQFVDLAIIGHSERRKNFNETPEIIEQKVKQALEHDIIPLVCVQDENTPVSEGVKLIAYEPIFAIGSGNPDTPENANQVASSFQQKFSNLEVLYGGSVVQENAKAFCKETSISGVLVGGASLDPEQFIKIIEELYFI